MSTIDTSAPLSMSAALASAESLCEQIASDPANADAIDAAEIAAAVKAHAFVVANARAIVLRTAASDAAAAVKRAGVKGARAALRSRGR